MPRHEKIYRTCIWWYVCPGRCLDARRDMAAPQEISVDADGVIYVETEAFI